jgi:lysine 6-dehydrogenase
MGYRYLVLGTGRQGTACAYDMGLYGDAEELILADGNLSFAQKSAERVKSLLKGRSAPRIQAIAIDVQRNDQLVKVLTGVDAFLSAVPYYLNPSVAQAAIKASASMCDLGGDIGIVQQELALHEKAESAGITIIPDCGLAPGMNNLLAVYAMEQMDRSIEVQIRCGGLPQVPKPPLGYRLAFNLEGLLNNYFGKAYVLRNGKVTEVESFTELETIEFPPPLGRCEAFVTAGATSTCPWSFERKVETYEYKTVRHSGHYEKFMLLRDLGLLNTAPLIMDDITTTPRAVFCKIVGPRIAFPQDKDVVVLRVVCRGSREAGPIEVVLDLMEFYDEETGFSAMERTTGFSASIIAIMMARKEIGARGVIPLEKAVSGKQFVAQLTRRGIKVQETRRQSQSSFT